MGSALINRNVIVSGHRTSMRLEPSMWDALEEICGRERLTVHEICTLVEARRRQECGLTAAIRVFILSYFRAAATDDGHARAGHGNGRPALAAALSGAGRLAKAPARCHDPV
ncbi:MAG: ribbon-helix-helix domain-containing protein [Rhodospirillales bacterium]|nr:ribbon-helix-helix domain-containing protein [Rhodospirillales bacterium]